VFLDQAAKLGEGEYGFWLTQVLRQWPITFQARLLYLLTAPENEDGILYELMKIMWWYCYG
jgi:hypothetical protein